MGLLFLLLIPLVWVVVLGAVAAGGWPALGKVYRRRDESPTVERRFRSIAVMAGWLPCNYGHCVTVGASRGGLFLRVFSLSRPSPPPLFIPWAAIQTTARHSWLGKWVELRCDGVPHTVVRLPTATAVELADEVGGF